MKRRTPTLDKTRNATPPHQTLAALGENALVERIAQWMRQGNTLDPSPKGKQPGSQVPPWAAQTVLTGIGDDTALVQLGGKTGPRLALTTDLLVEGTHFLSSHPPRILGAKAVEVNLSDLAAAGAWPAWILVSLGVHPGLSPEWIEALYAGMRDALAPYACPCLGGDTVRSEGVVLNIVAGGFLAPGTEPPLRSRARVGQSLYVTGTLGDSRAGLQMLLRETEGVSDETGPSRTTDKKKMKRPEAAPGALHLPERDRAFLLQRHQAPRARVAAGGVIARLCPDAAMMDLSDGLACDLPRLAHASHCGFEVRLASLPLSPALRRYATACSVAPDQIALAGGEDYELLFATSEPPERWCEAVAQAAGGRPLRITRIGRVTAESDNVRFVNRRGETVLPSESSFLHFSGKED
ncbi:MAG TPA: thiamine-phosphate kinase [Candidatus Sumerlaeota bacterium]|nr:thiamine-phosphate kinase [Candidatus Sumerlaeota bacterium]